MSILMGFGLGFALAAVCFDWRQAGLKAQLEQMTHERDGAWNLVRELNTELEMERIGASLDWKLDF